MFTIQQMIEDSEAALRATWRPPLDRFGGRSSNSAAIAGALDTARANLRHARDVAPRDCLEAARWVAIARSQIADARRWRHVHRYIGETALIAGYDGPMDVCADCGHIDTFGQ